MGAIFPPFSLPTPFLHADSGCCVTAEGEEGGNVDPIVIRFDVFPFASSCPFPHRSFPGFLHLLAVTHSSYSYSPCPSLTPACPHLPDSELSLKFPPAHTLLFRKANKGPLHSKSSPTPPSDLPFLIAPAKPPPLCLESLSSRPGLVMQSLAQGPACPVP